MQAGNGSSKVVGRERLSTRWKTLPAAVAAMLAVAAVQADPVPDGAPLTSGYGYDAEGNLTTVNLPKGVGQTAKRSQTHKYDSLGRRIATTLPAPSSGASSPTLGFGYDGLDQIKSVNAPLTNTKTLPTTYETTGLGNTGKLISKDTGTATSTYYDDGLLKSRTDAASRTFNYDYDGLGRLTSITYGSGTPSLFEYDGGPTAPNPNNSIGQLSKLTDESGATEYSHDGLGHVISKKQTVGAAKRVFTLGQKWGDAGTQSGKLENMTYPGQIRVSYEYDEAGRVKNITLNPVKADGTKPNLTQTIPLVSNIGYTPLSAPQSWTWGSGVAYARTYDDQGRLKTYPLGNPTGTGKALGIKRTVTYDDAGRISGFTHTDANYDQNFAHDGLDRLKQQQLLPGTTYDYDHDLNGNRKSLAINGTLYANTLDTDSNRILKENESGVLTSFSYSLAGDLKTATTGTATTTYTHGPRGRLSSIALPGTAGTVSYLYNGLGQRLVKTGPSSQVPGGARYFMQDEGGHTIGEYDKDGYPVYEVVYLGHTPVAAITQVRTTDANGVLNVQTKISYIYADHLDAPRVIARASDHFIQWRWDQSEAYGNTPANQNPNALGKFEFNLRFPGQLFDQESNLVYNHYRYYDASTGRYVESDPVGLLAGNNTYAYALGRPTGAVDRAGLASLDVVNSWTWLQAKYPELTRGVEIYSSPLLSIHGYADGLSVIPARCIVVAQEYFDRTDLSTADLKSLDQVLTHEVLHIYLADQIGYWTYRANQGDYHKWVYGKSADINAHRYHGKSDPRLKSATAPRLDDYPDSCQCSQSSSPQPNWPNW
jgi:RHS repeat-associated protein